MNFDGRCLDGLLLDGESKEEEESSLRDTAVNSASSVSSVLLDMPYLTTDAWLRGDADRTCIGSDAMDEAGECSLEAERVNARSSRMPRAVLSSFSATTDRNGELTMEAGLERDVEERASWNSSSTSLLSSMRPSSLLVLSAMWTRESFLANHDRPAFN